MKLDFFSPKEAVPWSADKEVVALAIAFDAPTRGIFGTSFGAVDVVRRDAEGKVSGKRSRSSCEEILGAAQDFQAAWPKMIEPHGFPPDSCSLPNLRPAGSPESDACLQVVGSTAQCC